MNPDIHRIRKCYVPADKMRAAERFRHHVWSPRNKRGRIHRLYNCCFCGKEGMTQAHHKDYARPFLVSWLCPSCHRLVEYGTIRLRPWHWFNYRSLVRAEPHRWRKGHRGPTAQSIIGYRRQKVDPDVPF